MSVFQLINLPVSNRLVLCRSVFLYSHVYNMYSSICLFNSSDCLTVLLFSLISIWPGEDIGESDEEEDGEADELIYDDFFRQDNDFGSDADSDGEQASASAIQRRDGMEILGPRFLTAPQNSHSQRAIKLDAEFEAVACSEREKDVVRLRAYCAVVHASPALLPYLGGGMCRMISSYLTSYLILPYLVLSCPVLSCLILVFFTRPCVCIR